MHSSHSNEAAIKFNSLHDLIKSRQQFEKKNFYPPYSTHKTDINFSDKDENTLLHYAVMMGDIERIQYCIDQGADLDLKNYFGKSAIVLALESDQLKAAEYLFEKGANCHELPLAVCINQEQKKWFTEKITTNHPQCVSEKNKIIRAAETGNLNVMKREIINLNSFSSDENYNINSLFKVAAANGQLEVMKFLQTKRVRMDGDMLYDDTSLMEAVKHGHDEIVNYLLSANVDVNKQDRNKHNAFIIAVISDNRFAMMRLLEKDCDVEARDINGDTVLHLAVAKKSSLLADLLSIPKVNELMNVKNIYGKTPLDIAMQNKNDAAIALLAPDFDANDIRADIKYGNKPVPIYQANIMKSMLYRLRLRYRDTEYFSHEGHCNGFAFLRSLYAAREMKSYYYDTLTLMANWDGDEKNLDKNFYTGHEHAQYYKNLDDLFEQWTNDVIWFQHLGLEKIDDFSQADRVQQYNLIKNKEEYQPHPLNLDEDEVIDFNFASSDDFHYAKQRLSELMGYLLKMPVKLNIEITGGKHATSGFINEQGEFDYYDPNFDFMTEVTQDLDKNIGYILDYKYILMTPKSAFESLQCQVALFYFKKDFDVSHLEQFEIFDRSSLPANTGDAIRFHHESPNEYTHLHVAVITRSLPSLKQLLLDGHCDLEAKDMHDRTALDVAIKMKFYEAIELFLQQPSHSFSSDLVKESDDEHLKEIFRDHDLLLSERSTFKK